MAKFCRVKNIKCEICGRRHYKLLCKESGQVSPKSGTSLWAGGLDKVLLQTLRVKLKAGRRDIIVRAILDTGSDQTYATKECLRKIGAQSCGQEVIRHTVFGGQVTPAVRHKKFVVEVEDLDGGYKTEFAVLDHEKVCCVVPSLRDEELRYKLGQQGVKLTDCSSDEEISLLIGMDHLPSIITGKQVRVSEKMLAAETKLGWTVMGCIGGEVPDQTETRSTALFVSITKNKPLADLWQLDTLGITDPIAQSSKSEREHLVALEFEESIRVREDGRYSVKLPWKSGHPKLLPNYECAARRLQSATASLAKRQRKEDYSRVIDEWIEHGIVTAAPEAGVEGKYHYLPHLPVIRETSETFKVRPVFDASATDPRGNSLNMCLETGPNLIEKIPHLLNRFRWKQFGVTADIKQAFLQIGLEEEDRDFLRFL